MRRSNSTTGPSFNRRSELTMQPATVRSAVEPRMTFNEPEWTPYGENQLEQQQEQLSQEVEQRQQQQQQQQQPRWPITDQNGPMPRLGYPAYRKNSFALPYTNSLSGSDDSAEVLQRTAATRKTIQISQMKMRGLIFLIVVLVVMGIILTGIAIGLSLRGEDNSKVTYYSKMKLDKTFHPDMADVRSYAFKAMELEICRTVRNSREIYQTALRACSLDDLRNGSVNAFTTLTFSVAELEHMVRMAGKIPTVAASEKILEQQLRRSGSSEGLMAGAGVMYVRKQPDSMNFNVRTEHEDMSWSDDMGNPLSAEYKNKKIEYCKAVHQAFRDSFRGCRVNEFLRHEKQVDATIRLTTDDIRYRGQRLGMATSPDKLDAVVREVLGSFKSSSAFFSGRKAPGKISVEHLVSEKTEAPTTTEPVTIIAPNNKTTKVNMETSSGNDMTDFTTTAANAATAGTAATAASAAAATAASAATVATPATSTHSKVDMSEMISWAEDGTEVTITTIVIHYNGSLNNISGAPLLNGSDVMSGVTVTLSPSANDTMPNTTPYKPVHGVGVDRVDYNDTAVISTITIDIPLSGLLEGFNLNDTSNLFTFNNDDQFATDDELPWCDD